jgi:hypothetical protein
VRLAAGSSEAAGALSEPQVAGRRGWWGGGDQQRGRGRRRRPSVSPRLKMSGSRVVHLDKFQQQAVRVHQAQVLLD